MNEQPTTGPMVESKRPKAPYNFTHFHTLMGFLQRWRNADHQDMISLHRSQMIEIIDGVQAMRGSVMLRCQEAGRCLHGDGCICEGNPR